MTPSTHPSGSIGAIASGHPDATRIGLEVLEAGGTAADAVVAAAFALFVVMPEACGLGGDAFALVATSETTSAFNGSGKPAADWRNTPWDDGAAAATVPGAVAALGDMHWRHGRWAWERLLRPSIDMASRGMLVSPTLRRALERRADVLNATARDWPVRRWQDSRGLKVRQPHLASVLERIAAEGPNSFYEGWISRELIASARTGGSSLSLSDLSDHATVMDDPVTIDVGEWSIDVSPPVSQAVLIPFALSAMGRAGRSDVLREHLLAEALEEGFIWRPLLDTRSAITHLPWDWVPPARPARRLVGARGTAHTTSVCASDSEGMVVALLVSVFHEFGSGHLIPELGFFLNDRMLGYLDTRGTRAERPVHTLSPALAHGPSTCMGIATPGADAQVQVLSQVLDGVIHEGLSWQAALGRPRWRLESGALCIEGDAAPALIRGFEEWGHDVRLLPKQDHSMGAVTVAGWQRKAPSADLACVALADGRRGSDASRTPP